MHMHGAGDGIEGPPLFLITGHEQALNAAIIGCWHDLADIIGRSFGRCRVPVVGSGLMLRFRHVVEPWEQRLEIEMGADDDKLLKTGWQPIEVEYILGAEERQAIAWMEPEHFIVYQRLDRLEQLLHLRSRHIGQKQEVLSLSHLLLEPDAVLL